MGARRRARRVTMVVAACSCALTTAAAHVDNQHVTSAYGEHGHTSAHGHASAQPTSMLSSVPEQHTTGAEIDPQAGCFVGMSESGVGRYVPIAPTFTRAQQELVATELTVPLPARINRSRIATDLAQQEVTVIDPTKAHLAGERAIPLEHAPRTQHDLCREYSETMSFLTKTLKKDPKSPPAGQAMVDVDHLNSCLGCVNHAHMRASLHNMAQRNVGTEVQWLVDDYVLHRWRNAIRFLNPPALQQVVLTPPTEETGTRFGCPCSAAPAIDGGVNLWHAGALANGTMAPHPRKPGAKSDPTGDEHEIQMRYSTDGITGWSSPASITMPGVTVWRQFTVGAQLDTRDRDRPLFVSGFEGHGGEACIALSKDGINWRNVYPQLHDPNTYIRYAARTCPTNAAPGAYISIFGRAADASVVPVYDAAQDRDLLWFRKDFGSNSGWREIRGVQVVQPTQHPTGTPIRFADIQSAVDRNITAKRLTSWYLDRLGKMERFRRQIYSLSLTPYGTGLWIGLMTVVEWAKDTVSEPVGDEHPAFERDTTQVYLVTSRDGVSVDDGWVYALRPLLQKGRLQASWDSGVHLPAPQIVNDASGHKVYFEARREHHEDRFKSKGVIGMASWSQHRIVGLRQANASAPAEIVTKVFGVVQGGTLWVEVDCTRTGSRATVAVLTADENPMVGFEATACVPIHGDAGKAVQVRWQEGTKGLADAGAAGALKAVRLLFVLERGARLYSFRVRQRRHGSIDQSQRAPL